MLSSEPSVVGRARRHLNAREYDAAVAVLGEHLRSHPDDPEALNVLGLATFQLGRLDDSLGAYRTMWTVLPTDVRALFGTGMVFQRMGRFDDAAAWFTATLAVDPTFERAKRRLAELPAQRASAPPGTARAGGQPRGRRAMSTLIVPEDEEELEVYRRTSRDRARIDLMNQYWYGIPWPVRVLQVIVAVVIVVGLISSVVG